MLGLNRQDILSSEELPETKILVETFDCLTKSDLPQALGALYAYESQVPDDPDLRAQWFPVAGEQEAHTDDCDNARGQWPKALAPLRYSAISQAVCAETAEDHASPPGHGEPHTCGHVHASA